jgi:fatty-acyl-CoA synthase
LPAAENTLARDPRNRFRIAHGNGALPADREKLMRCLGMEHIYELYGSTEAPISTIVKPGDPPDSVGEIDSSKVVILNERDESCPPGIADAHGRLLNYEEAVGEICRKMGTDNIFFDGYLGDRKASEKKFRGGYFHSGDLGHVRLVGRKRYLYFNGRTDDWIRKDGENFSAENVAHYAARLPDVAMAVAFGIPSEVSDEKVMVAVQMKDAAPFDPKAAFDYYRDQSQRGGMDPKWMPDFIRVVNEFEMTETQKLLVRPLKRHHFRPRDDAPVYFRERGDESYRLLTPGLYQELEARFRDTGRLDLLGR